MNADTAPTTEAGRALLAAFAADPCDCRVHHGGADHIILIEAEAVAEYRKALAARVKALPRLYQPVPTGMDGPRIDRNAVLALIEQDTPPAALAEEAG